MDELKMADLKAVAERSAQANGGKGSFVGVFATDMLELLDEIARLTAERDTFARSLERINGLFIKRGEENATSEARVTALRETLRLADEALARIQDAQYPEETLVDPKDVFDIARTARQTTVTALAATTSPEHAEGGSDVAH